MTRSTAACVALAVLTAGTSRAQPLHDATAEEVTEATFRQQVAFWLTDHARRSGTLVCLSVDQSGVPRSVTQEYLQRFREPSVRRGADCENRAGSVVDRATGRPAVMVTVGAISWAAPDEAWVTVRYDRKLSSGSQQYRVVKEQARWICLGPIVKLSPA